MDNYKIPLKSDTGKVQFTLKQGVQKEYKQGGPQVTRNQAGRDKYKEKIVQKRNHKMTLSQLNIWKFKIN